MGEPCWGCPAGDAQGEGASLDSARESKAASQRDAARQEGGEAGAPGGQDPPVLNVLPIRIEGGNACVWV